MKDWKIYSVIKRMLDIIFSFLLIILLSPLMLIISVVIALDSEGGVLFCQERVGVRGESFVCYKFRTMKTNTPPNISTREFKDSYKYITPMGRFLRRSSLDELPQLFNVLIGNMSIVGPRPLIKEERDIHDLNLINQLILLMYYHLFHHIGNDHYQ